ncbi:hypothetical protein QG37_04712 [Candidozyma auris]|uniref:Uncharacterized protein n=1 Tax=Candidozyma auris TaxID=498019 RepID=A0A0L0NX69_CANAR|nr:hypothetical protein QG37_04712 [[Candida] auris]
MMFEYKANFDQILKYIQDSNGELRRPFQLFQKSIIHV